MQKRRMEQALRRMRHSGTGDRPTPIQLARTYASAGEKDLAMHWLQKAFEERTPQLSWLKNCHDWAPVRADPRFQELVRKMNYPD